jgi:Rps23 Pro-64 3,4-dihydroxylase Tpa1-like proline 4-hydroxylase
MTFDSPPSQDVEVTVLLTGGHQYTLPLQADAPLLRQLFEVILNAEQDHAKQIFQLPVQKGRAMLCFRGDRLMGLITDPPILIRPESDETELDYRSEQYPPLESTFEQANILPSHFIQLDNFLTLAEQKRLLDYTLQHERESVVLHSFPEFSKLITRRIHAVIPDVLAKLELPPFKVTQIEAQLTAHNDRNYYKIHNDNGSPETTTRELTYVYYFYREPKPFSGGELLIYDSKIENNYYVQAETFHTVEPRNNSIVFFLSRYMHEVLPVRCPSRVFADSRFTINGWVRR